MVSINPEVQPVRQYHYYYPIVQKGDRCTQKSGVALGAISDAAFDELCLSNWYEYNLIDYDRYEGSTRFYVYWCDEYIDPDGRVYVMRQQMLDNHDPTFSGYLIFMNEWGYPGQCQATPQQYIAEFQWLKEHYPQAKIIIGNTYGHDHQNGYTDLIAIHDLIVSAGYDWSTAVHGIGVHDYSMNDPSLAIERLRELQDEWGSTYPVYITEFVTLDLQTYLTYYENQNDVKAWFWFLPCNTQDQYDLLTNRCTDTLTDLGLQMRGLNTK